MLTGRTCIICQQPVTDERRNHCNDCALAIELAWKRIQPIVIRDIRIFREHAQGKTNDGD